MTYVFFDLEATGLDTDNDRICEVAFIEYGPDFQPTGNRLCSLVNPGTPMDGTEAGDVHGIKDADVANAPPFRELAPRIQAMVDGAILGGQNLRGYDMPLLDAELRRAGQPGIQPSHPVIDTLAIEAKAVPRTLSAMHERYAGSSFDDAHRASADVEATARIAAAQVTAHGLPSDPDALVEYCQPEGRRNLDFGGKVYADPDGTARFGFGKHRDEAILASPDTVSYANWMLGKDFPASTKDALRHILAGTSSETPKTESTLF